MGDRLRQTRSVLDEAKQRLKIRTTQDEQALLTFWHDLFRSGVLAWGYNIDNPEPPFLHLTEQGRKALKHISGDPLNKDGYLARIKSLQTRNPVAWSYIAEAVETYAAGCFKATAVILGAAAEAQVLELRDEMVSRLNAKGTAIPRGLQDWRVKTARDSVTKELEARKGALPQRTREVFQGFWIPVTETMRIARNDAGHPSSIEPVEQADVHAGLLLFPRLVELVSELKIWVKTSYP
ncbi:MAG: hypothetical protein JXA30_22220 [Deltaproteobacteria bacterium]|nr:hypothetical protein [Deltaproteobacteria bacterium]